MVIYGKRFALMKLLQKTKENWKEPGKCAVKEHEGFISSHPGEDRDTDSEDEKEDTKKGQAPVPIQDEPINEDAVEETTTVEPEDGGESDREMDQDD